MSITDTLAARAYAASKPATAPQASDGDSTIREKLASFADTMRQSEAAAVQSATIGNDPHVLVEALTQTELAVEAAVTIRDKVVQAYQEILRMPI